MRIRKDKSITREASFKENKNIDSDLDDIEAKFVRRLKKGSGKYQGKLPLKCFNYGKIGYFENKCPHKKKDQNYEGEEKYKSKRFGRKKSLCVDNDDDPSDDEEDMVDLEGELISALEEIDRLKLKKRKEKQLMIQFEKGSKKPDE